MQGRVKLEGYPVDVFKEYKHHYRFPCKPTYSKVLACAIDEFITLSELVKRKEYDIKLKTGDVNIVYPEIEIAPSENKMHVVLKLKGIHKTFYDTFKSELYCSKKDNEKLNIGIVLNSFFYSLLILRNKASHLHLLSTQ